MWRAEMHDELVRVFWLGMVSVGSVVFSFIWAFIDDVGVGSTVLGATGIVGLVALLWKLAADYQAHGELVKSYVTALKEERDENHRLRTEVVRLQDES
jgi:hypothetical protein